MVRQGYGYGNLTKLKRKFLKLKLQTQATEDLKSSLIYQVHHFKASLVFTKYLLKFTACVRLAIEVQVEAYLA